MARPSKFTDDVVLTRAMTTFWQNGYSATSIRDLEVAMSLKAPSIYRRFHSKERLFEACVNHYLERVIEQRVTRYLNVSSAPMRDIRAFFESAVDPGPEEHDLIGCLIINTAIESPALPTSTSRLVRSGIERVGDALGSECERAHKAGQLAKDPESTAGRLQTEFLGLMVLARSGADATSLQQRIGQLFEPA